MGAIVSALGIQSAAGSRIVCSTPAGVTVHGLCPETEGPRCSDLPPPLLHQGSAPSAMAADDRLAASGPSVGRAYGSGLASGGQ